MILPYKFTAGKWKLHNNQPWRIDGRRHGEASFTTLAEVFGQKDEREANAVLIASSPDLLGHLHSILYAHQNELYDFDARMKEAALFVKRLNTKLR